ncbi:unnamed protein product, partial [Brenthis ino]
MDTKLVVLCTLVCTVVGSDVSVGKSTGRKIFDEVRQANPAIWRQIENVTIIAPSDEVISGVVVTDMRPEKDGDAQIVDGGKGKDSVTIELKSPTVLRGYEFHLEVYTESNTKYTDAEENLPVPDDTSNKDLPEMNESTTVSEGSGSGDHVSVSMSNENVTTELPENSDKDAPSLVGKDTDGNVRPARGIDFENISQTSGTMDVDNVPVSTTDMPTENLTTELSENTDKDAPAFIGQDLNESVRPARETNEDSIPGTTETANTDNVTERSEGNATTGLPNNSDKDAPSSIGKDLNENIRPARRTDDEDISQTSDAADTANIPSIIASEASTTEDPKIDQDQTTTEVNEKTTIEEEVTPAPVIFDNAKNIPDYPSLDILDLIKAKEGTRLIRHTEENEVTTESENIEQSTTESNEKSESYDVSSEPSEKTNDDDIVDLMPPEIGASYNTDFSDNASSNPRSGRGVSIVDIANDSTTTEATTVNDKEEKETEFSTTEALMTEQPRNTRNAGVEDTDVDSNNVDIPKEPQEQPSWGSRLGNSNVIVLNRELFSPDSSQTRYEIPIVLILANGANLPTIKIIVENSNFEQEKPDVNIQSESPTVENLASNDEIPKNVDETDFMPPNDEYASNPVMILEK